MAIMRDFARRAAEEDFNIELYYDFHLRQFSRTKTADEKCLVVVGAQEVRFDKPKSGFFEISPKKGNIRERIVSADQLAEMVTALAAYEIGPTPRKIALRETNIGELRIYNASIERPEDPPKAAHLFLSEDNIHTVVTSIKRKASIAPLIQATNVSAAMPAGTEGP